MARLVLPHADGKAPAMKVLRPLGLGDADDQHVLGHPAFVAGQHARQPQREALLAQECVAAVVRVDADHQVLVGKMADVALGRIESARRCGCP